ncbi:GspH/FimT family protein [Oxalicibacterium flavum]|nr:GspH/FimT family pseudopilin [Oxalicibacterium flavum]
MRSRLPFRFEPGFTATEFMIVVVIVGIVLAVAAPSFQSLLIRHRLVTTTNALFMAVNLARSEAIRRGSRVDLVPAGDGSAWTKGWIVFIDGNGNRRPDPGEAIVLQHEAAHDSLRIAPRFTDSKVQYLAFDGSGRTRTHASSQTPQTGHWLLEAGTQSRKIVIGFLGRPRVCNPQSDGSSC